MLKKILMVLGALVGVLVLGAGGFLLWANSKVSSRLSAKYEVHRIEFPIPYPLTEEEIAALREERKKELERAVDSATEATPDEAAEADPDETTETAPAAVADVLAGVDLEAIALERAVARGEHLVKARYLCVECHGQDFSGGVMMDNPVVGVILGPNITTGKGGMTSNYVPADWDRIVRHGVKPDGRAAAMPSEDFQVMTDRELSDIIAYIRSQPPVDNEVTPVTLGPVGTVLMATGKLPLSADVIHDHNAEHQVIPPEEKVSVEFGKHLAGVCTGCHRENLEGGQVASGDPAWPPAQNLTPHADGLQGWTAEQFDTLMRTGKRPDGTEVLFPMTLLIPYTNRLSEVEMAALWAYISSVPPQATGH